jgi:hypothetical protein
MNEARRSLLKLVPDYTLEFLWIMSKYDASSLESCRQLIASPSMKRHLAKNRDRVQQILAKWPTAFI